MIKRGSELVPSKEIVQLMQKSIHTVRDEIRDSPYISEALKVLRAEGYRSAIGSYWNAVVDDLRRKVIHRSLDLFNKEMSCKPELKTYEDFQDHVTDHSLIEGAYKIGVIDWEARKMLHHARETRNIFDGHPHSSDPSPLKVIDMFNDCNKYVLSQDFPLSIINIGDYISIMERSDYDKNPIAIEQAFSDLPGVYKSELANRFYTIYISPASPLVLRANVELSAPILWRVLQIEVKKQVAKRYNTDAISGDVFKVEKGAEFLAKVDGIKYVSTATRRILLEPLVAVLEKSLDQWKAEAEAVEKIFRFGSSIPDDLVLRYVSALTRTYVGYRGSSAFYSRRDFYSDAAAPVIAELFKQFDDNAVSAFVRTIKKDTELRSRVKNPGQLRRLRNLASIVMERPRLPSDAVSVLELLADESRTDEFYEAIRLKTT